MAFSMILGSSNSGRMHFLGCQGATSGDVMMVEDEV